MTDPDLQQVRDRLLDLRAELETMVSTSHEAATVVELDQTKVGRLSRMDAMQAQAMAKASGQRRETLLRGIAAALQRIENGDYGTCIDCREPIAAKRLEFDPAVTRCIGCASRQEQQ